MPPALPAWRSRLTDNLPEAASRHLRNPSHPVRLTDRELTVVYVHASAHRVALGSYADQIAGLAESEQVRIEPSANDELVLSCARPRQGLRAALRILGVAGAMAPRIGVASGRCREAAFWAEGRRYQVALGEVIGRAEAVALRHGAIGLCARAYDEVQADVEEGDRPGVLVKAFDNGRFTHALLLPSARVYH